MRKSLFLIIVLLAFLTSCQKKMYTLEEDGGVVAKCRITGMEEHGESIEQIDSILTLRLKHVAPGVIPTIRYNEPDSTYAIELPGLKTERIAPLFAHGNMTISEIYTYPEVVQMEVGMNLVDSIRYYYTLEMTLNPSLLLSNINEVAVATVDSIIGVNRERANFPEDIKFAWEYVDGERANLYMLRDTDANININRTFKKSAIKPGIEDRYDQMDITLNDEGAEQFYDLTKKNIGRILVICVDNTVLLAPMVYSEIEGGQITISGTRSKSGLMLLNSLLYSPIIKSDIEILATTIVDKPNI
ncbi:hypothetical protein [Dysgonomonas sp. 25]|uniref:SecDF P1 head subdomain-containing protein n=1 Tax=Dysgonomonas sp. 25 TaxID=2302933 RepID=UPI0013D1094D|nr:hypothetical protein [Dysgonomonas sp. 25]NDV70368.1 hypothetical protein [Dysgonomonas sp. 25]